MNLNIAVLANTAHLERSLNNATRHITATAQKVDAIGAATRGPIERMAALDQRTRAVADQYTGFGRTATAQLQRVHDGARQVESQMGGIESVAKRLGPQLVAAFSVGAITSAIARTTEWAGKIQDVSDKLGISAETTQRFQQVASLTGSSIDQVATAMSQLSKRVTDGGAAASEAFQRLGLDISALQKLQPDQLFAKVGTAIGAMEDPTQRTAMAMELLGRSGVDLIPMLTNLEASLEKTVVASNAAIAKADELGDAWDRLKNAGQVTLTATLNMLLPAGVSDAVGFLERLTARFSTLADAIARIREQTPVLSTLFPTMLNPVSVVRTATGLDQSRQALADALGQLQPVTVPGFQPPARPDLAEVERETRAYEQLLRQQRETARLLESSRPGRRDLGPLAMYAAPADITRYANEYAQAIDQVLESRQLAETRVVSLYAQPPDIAAIEAQWQQVSTTIEAVQLQTTDRVQQMWMQVGDGVSDAFGRMLTGMESFKSGMEGIWRSLQQSVASILSDMLRNYIQRYLTGMLAATRQQQGGLAQSAAGMLPSVGGMGAGSFVSQSVGGVQSAALGGGIPTSFGGGGAGFSFGSSGLAMYGTGALAGGVAGFSAGYGTRSTSAGVLSGAATGALTGMQFGGIYGAAIGAGVGAIAGWIGAGAGRRQEEAAVRAERQRFLDRFGGLAGIEAKVGPKPWSAQSERLWLDFMKAHTMSGFASAATALEQRLAAVWNRQPTSYSFGQPNYAWPTFDVGGVVPGRGRVFSALLGGEGVLSHRGMQALGQLNQGQAPHESSITKEDFGDFRAELARDIRRGIGVAMREGFAMARR